MDWLKRRSLLEKRSRENHLVEIDEKLEGKVDKEEGKGLSSNDYTAEDREKLTGTVKVIVTDDDTTPPADTSALWVHG